MKKLVPFGTDINYDRLLDEKDEYIRLAPAEDAYALDRLFNDPSEKVRAAVAKNAFALELLINDPDSNVRLTAEEALRNFGYNSIKEWAEENPDRVIDKNKIDEL